MFSSIFNFKNYDFKRYNYTLIIVVALLGAIGCYLIRQLLKVNDYISASTFLKQALGFTGGLIAAIVISLIDYHFICKFYIVLYVINLVLLVLVKVAGVSKNYSKRWIDLKFMQLQPSELTKIIFIIFFAVIFTTFHHKINNLFFLLLSIIALAVPTYLILTQTDLSTSLVIMAVFAVILFSAGLSWKIILPVILVGVPLFFGLFWYVQQDYQTLLDPYQQERILSLLNPEEHQDTMYQQDNSIQAIGSGQLLGKTLTEGTNGPRGYDLVPVAESDFIFSVAGEELGFIGSCFVLCLYAIIIYMSLMIAKRAPDQLGMLIAIGIASLFMFQVFINIGVATRILPNTGIPLPFLSSGLSSLMSGMMALGIVLNIGLQRKKNNRNKPL